MNLMHWPGIQPRSTAWKAAMLTTIPPMPLKPKMCTESWRTNSNLGGAATSFSFIYTKQKLHRKQLWILC